MNECKCEWCHHVPNISGDGYCRRHYDQIRKYGKILDVRTRTDDNRIEIKDDCAVITITNAKDQVQGYAIISKQDVERMKYHHWTMNTNGYVKTYNGTTPLYLHRYIMDCPAGMEVDHINHNKLDNRRENLRIVTRAVNQRNTASRNIHHVMDRRLRKPFYARVFKDGVVYKQAYFETEKQAAAAVAKWKKESAEL